MFKKILLIGSLTLSSLTFAANNNGTLTVINKIESDMPATAFFLINDSKNNVNANNHFVDTQITSNKVVEFAVSGMRLGNTFQSNVSSNCHLQLRPESGKKYIIEIHSPPDDQAGYGKLITCVLR